MVNNWKMNMKILHIFPPAIYLSHPLQNTHFFTITFPFKRLPITHCTPRRNKPTRLTNPRMHLFSGFVKPFYALSLVYTRGEGWSPRGPECNGITQSLLFNGAILHFSARLIACSMRVVYILCRRRRLIPTMHLCFLPAFLSVLSLARLLRYIWNALQFI